MNPTAIEWAHLYGPDTGFTWNPVVGCTAGCSIATTGYDCYARRQAKRQRAHCHLCYDFVPHLHPERLTQPNQRQTPAGIFVGSMCDLFDLAVQLEWRERIWHTCSLSPQHTFLVLTKKPQNITTGDLKCLPGNVHLGVTINRPEEEWRWRDLLAARRHGLRLWAGNCFVSIEPLLGLFDRSSSSMLGRGPFPHPSWVIAGGDTTPGALAPDKRHTDSLARLCFDTNVPYFAKHNLGATADAELVGRQEWPAWGHRP